MTPLSVIELLPATTLQVENFATFIKDAILNGEMQIGKFLHQKKIIEKTFEAISEDKDVKSAIENEIDKYGKDGLGYGDMKFELGNRKTWDYSNTEDSELFRLEKEKAELDKQIKDRQKLLQTAKKPFADIETGEIIYPASYSEKTYVKATAVKR